MEKVERTAGWKRNSGEEANEAGNRMENWGNVKWAERGAKGNILPRRKGMEGGREEEMKGEGGRMRYWSCCCWRHVTVWTIIEKG